MKKGHRPGDPRKAAKSLEQLTKKLKGSTFKLTKTATPSTCPGGKETITIEVDLAKSLVTYRLEAKGSYEKACQRSAVTDTNFFCSVLRRALTRTLDGSAFDPVHARVRRGVLLSATRTL